MKDSFEIDGKIYISSRRAAEISKYSNDYVGQLCRGGKVSARMMGRTWFVDQESILNHKKTSEEAFQARCRAASREQQKVFATSGGAAVLPAYSQPTWGITYGSDERPLMPVIQKVVATPSPVSSLDQAHASSIRVRNALIASIIVVVLVTGGLILNNNSTRTATLDGSSQPAHVYASVERIIQAVGSGFGKMFALVERMIGGKSNLADNVVVPVVPSNSNSWNGMAVIPSGADDQAAVEQIRNSFSDVVEVSPDGSGTAGVITPVFRKTTGDEFLYVLVPVNDADKAISQ
jgi:hypothetical protein